MANTYVKTGRNVKSEPRSGQNILIYSDFGCTTGFGNLAKELVDRWSRQLTETHITVFALNCNRKNPYSYNQRVTVMPAHLYPGDGVQDVYCRSGFLCFVAEMPFDVVVMIQDIEVVNSIRPSWPTVKNILCGKGFDFPKTVFYFPVDSVPKSTNIECLQDFDEIITYTDYGKKVICNINPDLSEKLHIVPHGVDLKKFHPIQERKRISIRRKMFGKKSYIVGSVNRNSARKDVATTVLAYDIFRKTENGLKSALYLHMNPVDPSGVNLINLCESLGMVIGKDVFFPHKFSENIGFSENELNEIYNSLDVFVSTSTAEGWGLTITEAMACGVPVICGEHTSLHSITDCGKRALSVKESMLDQVVFHNDGEKVRYKLPVDEVSRLMAKAYDMKNQDSDDLSVIVKRGKEYAEEIDWDSSANSIWEKIVKYLPKPY